MKTRLLRQSLLGASVVIIATSMFSRVLGYVREAVIANYFGTSSIFDTFILAFTVPEFITFIIMAALPSALIPSLRKIGEGGSGEDASLFWPGALVFAAIFGAISFLLFATRGRILSWFAPGLIQQQQSLAEDLIGILSWFVFFRGMEAYFRSWLFDKKHFIAPATSAVALNVVLILSLVLLHGRFDIKALAFGWLLGSIVLFLYNGYFALLIVRPKVVFCERRGWVRVLLKSSLAIAAMESISLIYPVIDRYLAAKYLGPGQISALRYALVLIQIPAGILVVSYNLASFPWISDLSNGENAQRLKKLYKESVGMLVFTMGFVAMGVVIFSKEIVQVAFQRGAFDTNSLQLTSGPLTYYALGVVFFSVYTFHMRFYFAAMSLSRLGAILLIMVCIKGILSLILVSPMEHNGLALATTITWFAGSIIMVLDLRPSFYADRGRVFPIRNLLCRMCSLVAVGLLWTGLNRMWTYQEGGLSHLELFLRLSIFAILGVVLYVGFSSLLKIPEASRLLSLLRQRRQPSSRGSAK